MAAGQRKRRAPTPLSSTPKKGRTASVQPPGTPAGAVGRAATPDPNWFDAADPAKVRAVKAALHASREAHKQLPLCRDREVTQLQSVLQRALHSGRGGFTYVAGTPGIGKTLTVRAVVLAEAARLGGCAPGKADAMPPPALVYMNCMSLDGNTLLGRVAEGLQRDMHRTLKQAREDPLHQPTGKVTFPSTRDAKERLQSLLANPNPTKAGGAQRRGARGKQQGTASLRIVILDELDGLLGSTASLLELKELLGMACEADSHLLVVGISNSINLIDQCADDLSIKAEEVQKVLFNPYTRQQMAAILEQQMQRLPGPVFEPMALRLCAAKMADNHGDVRKALSTCEAALDMLVDDADTADETAGSRQGAGQRRLVGPDEVSRAAAMLAGGSGGSSEKVEAIRELPADQKVALIAAYQLAGGSSAPAASSGSSASAATEVFLREDSRGSLDSSANAAGRTGNSLGFRSRKPGTPVRAASSGGSGRSSKGVFGRGRQDCRLGALHRHYQALCKLMVHEHVQTLGFGEFQCAVSDLMTRVLTCRLARNRADSVVTLAASGDDIEAALGDSHVYRQLLAGKC